MGRLSERWCGEDNARWLCGHTWSPLKTHSRRTRLSRTRTLVPIPYFTDFAPIWRAAANRYSYRFWTIPTNVPCPTEEPPSTPQSPPLLFRPASLPPPCSCPLCPEAETGVRPHGREALRLPCGHQGGASSLRGGSRTRKREGYREPLGLHGRS